MMIPKSSPIAIITKNLYQINLLCFRQKHHGASGQLSNNKNTFKFLQYFNLTVVDRTRTDGQTLSYRVLFTAYFNLWKRVDMIYNHLYVT